MMFYTSAMTILEQFLKETFPVLLNGVEDGSDHLSTWLYIRKKGMECTIFSSIVFPSVESFPMAVIRDTKPFGIG